MSSGGDRVRDPGADLAGQRDLVGRDGHLEVLRRAWHRAATARATVVFLEGEPGMGKSHLLDAFLRPDEFPGAQPPAGTVLRWRGDEFERDVPFGAIGMLLGEHGLDCSDTEAGRLLLARLEEAQAGAPTVLVLDDTQWMDQPSARAIRFAGRRLRNDAVLAIVARRPGPLDLLPEDPDVTVLELGPLTPEDVTELARRLRSWRLPPAVAREVVARTGGVPLLVAAVVRGATSLSQLSARGFVPQSAAAAAKRLLQAAGEQARLLIEASAVVAEPCDLLVLGRIAGLADPETALADAVSAGLLTTLASGEVDCPHALLREAVSRSLGTARRRELHARAADRTTGDRRLAHRAAAADRPDPSLASELLAAADAARDAQEFGRSANHRLRARSVASDPTAQERLLVDALLDRLDGQDLPGSRQLAPAVRRTAAAPTRDLALGLLARETGDVPEAIRRLRRSAELAARSGDADLRARAGLAEAVLRVRLNQPAAAIHALTATEDSHDPVIVTDAATWRGTALYLDGRLAESIELLANTPAGAGSPGEPELLAVRGMVRMQAGQLREAAADLDAAIGRTHRWRTATHHSRTYALRSVVRAHLGDWDGAVADASAARALSLGAAQTWSAATAFAISVDVPALRGHLSTAAGYLSEAKRAAQLVASDQVADTLARHEVVHAHAQGDPLLVLGIVEPLMTDPRLERLARSREHRHLMTVRVQALLRLDRVADAAHALEHYLEVLDTWPGGPEPTRLGWLRGHLALAQGRPQDAGRHFADDLADPATAEAPFVHAQLLYDIGRLHRRTGAEVLGIECLTKARSILGGLRATALLARCEEALGAGAGSQVADLSTLTEREESVAALAATRHTNPPIADEMFLTDKTVEYHLHKVYGKLGVAGRKELARVWPSAW